MSALLARLMPWLNRAFLLGALKLGGLAVVGRRAEVGSALGSIGWLPLLVSGLAGLAGVFLSARVWMASIRAVGGPARLPGAPAMFFMTQVGKYLSSRLVWPYITVPSSGSRVASA